MSEKIRLFVDTDLGPEQPVLLSRDQAHYLFAVMRQSVDARLSIFNGRDGEWRARVAELGKRGGVLACEAQTAPLRTPPDLWILFAPIKKARTDFIVEKATEMGAAQICPILTEYTRGDKVRLERLQAHAIEAAEQCGGTYVPSVKQPNRLKDLLAQWDSGRQIMFCDEELAGQGVTIDAARPGPWAILIGPEGGFSPTERAQLASVPYATSVSLGPRILRADTAAVAAMTVWQQRFGDW